MLTSTRLKKLPASITVLSLLVALYVDIKPLNWSLVYGGFTGEGLMNTLYPVTVLFVVAIGVLFTNRIKSISPRVLFLTVYLFLFYYISANLIGPPETKFTMLMTFVFASFLIPSFSVVDAKLFLRGIMLFPFIAVFNIDTVFATTAEWTDYVSMDVSYGFLLPVIGTIVYAFLYLGKDKGRIRIIMLLLCGINAIFFLEIFLRGSRGALLSVVLLMIFLFLVKKNDNLGVKYSKGKINSFLLVLFILLMGYVFFAEIIVNGLSVLGVKSYALSKIIELNQEGDISNGRSMLNAVTFQGIIEHPLLGNGLDRFNANTGRLYPHNFILQILYDGGLLFFFVLMVPIIKSVIEKYKTCTYDEYAVYTCMMFGTIPGAMFSGNLYSSGLLWLFFGMVLSNRFVFQSNFTQLKK